MSQQEKAALALVRTIAKMYYDGEEIAGQETPFLLENDDAVDTVNSLIDSARRIVNKRDEP